MEVKSKLMDVKEEIKTQFVFLQILMNDNSEIGSINDTVVKRELGLNAVDFSSTNNPTVNYLQELILSKEKQIAIHKTDYYPEFSVGYFNQSMLGNHSVNGIEQYYGSDQRFQGVNATISLPVFTRATKSKVNAAKIERQIAQTNAEFYKIRIENEYRIAVNNYIKTKTQLAYFENSVLEQVRLIIETSNLSYKSGNISTLEYIQSLNAAIDLKSKYNQILNRYNQTVIEIEYLVGK